MNTSIYPCRPPSPEWVAIGPYALVADDLLDGRLVAPCGFGEDGSKYVFLSRGPVPGLIVYMDAFGLRPRIQDMTQRIADWGYVVLAPNVFYREGTMAELAPAADMSTQEGREAAGKAAFPGLAA